MPHFIEIKSLIPDSRAQSLKRHLENIGFKGKIRDITLVDIYTIDKKFQEEELKHIAKMLTNPVIETSLVNGNFVILNDHPVILSNNPVILSSAKDLTLKNHRKRSFTRDPSVGRQGDLPQDDKKAGSLPQDDTWIIEKGFLPGVTDNVAHTVKQGIEDLLKTTFSEKEGVYTAQAIYLTGKIKREEAERIASELVNPLIARVRVKSPEEFQLKGSIGLEIPKVNLVSHPKADEIDLDIPDKELSKLGKEGIKNADGTRRGPLALNLDQLKAIRDHFKKRGRNPTDIELESLAQTWSEHCKHTLFSSEIDEIKDGLYQHFIKRATEKIRKAKGANDFCISVFKDNSGIIALDDNWAITHKVETHNTPSALDPFGGAITGIVGVNRDTIGTGMGAKPILNFYGFCFADPRDETPLYKGANKTQKMLSPRRIMEGVIEGVNVGGNCSGIPTPHGFVYFDEKFKGKPLVFVGTVGLIPRKIKGKLSHIKKALPGDFIVMIGGRVGKDGIHGATFSSEMMDSESPVTAVQIGDPITQKKFSDAIVKEIRDLDLFHSITDCGAGGISCSVTEMAKESGGCYVELEKIPTKYPNLSPWEIWISESQERMTLAVPPEKWKTFAKIMKKHDVTATIIGQFNNSGRCVITMNETKIFDIELEFLHEGVPAKILKTHYVKKKHEEPKSFSTALKTAPNLTAPFLDMISRLNTAGTEFISRQYDHEVQCTSVLKPLQGKGRVKSDVAVNKPLYDSEKGVVTSFGLNPRYSDIDSYHMAACAIDTAIRNAVSAGANLDHLAILDNFCWCSADEPERLGQLKEAARACYDFATIYGAPFISGKDSMFNDFKGFDENGNPIKISIPPTLLISTLGVINNVEKVVSLDFKMADDLIYLLGETSDELGGSEWYSYLGEKERKKPFIGNKVPQVNAKKNIAIYRALYKAIQKDLIASSQSLNLGGLAVALTKSAIGGQLGCTISLEHAKTTEKTIIALFSESQGRMLVTIAPKNKETFEKIFTHLPHTFLGKTTNDQKFIIKTGNSTIVKTDITHLTNAYRSTFQNF